MMTVETMKEHLKEARARRADWSAGGCEATVVSLLSDAQELLDMGRIEAANDRINLSKYFLLKG